MKTLIQATLVILLVLGLAGCVTCPGSTTESKPAPAMAPAPAPAAAQPQSTGDNVAIRDYMNCGAIRLEKVLPETVQVNSPFEYTIKLTNLTDMMLADVEVTEQIPAGLKDLASSPAAKSEGDTLIWKMDALGPKASETITVKATPTRPGDLQTCANVTYVLPACASTMVVQPALAVTKTAPATVTVCDMIPLKFVVTNKGTGTASNVKISDALPDGLTAQDGKKSIELMIGNLEAGQSATRTVMAKASKPGTYKNQAVANADGNLKAESEVTTTVVTQPVLAIEKTGPKKEYLGRSIEYKIVVTNKGDAVAANTVITDTIPAGVTNVQAAGGGVVTGNTVTWNVGDLPPKAVKTVSLSYQPSQGGKFSNTAKATAVCADAVSSSMATEINAIPAILLEVVDVTDPIEVGTNATYVITVTNQGSAVSTGIVIKAMLEDSMSYVSATGATNGSIDAGTITFDKLASLAPKARATWRVVVKAVKAGDVRFKVAMNSDQLDRDVEETEATNFYE